jgi:phosphatidylserine decarboxylase
MHIPINCHGVRELGLYGTPLLAATIALAFVLPWLAPIPGLVLLWMLWFFRDPTRRIPEGEGLFVAPADGRVTDIGVVEVNEFLPGPALRIGIFLNVFSVHVNRVPCAGRVAYVKYTPGKFHHADAPESRDENERQSLGLETEVGPILVRQIAGLIARRIVCDAEMEQDYARGDRYGMIKFGSRTELYVPAEVALDVRVEVGQHVSGGSTVLAALAAPDGGAE